MKKRIAFFTVGFAFNRLIRMQFYEKIFPKNVELFLITTDKYKGKEKESYQQEYVLQRTKVVKMNYNPFTLPFELRRYCEKNKIDRIINLGYHASWPLLLFSTLCKKRDYCLNVLTEMFDLYKMVKSVPAKIKEILSLIYMYPSVIFAKKVFFTAERCAKRAPIYFLSSKNKMKWLAAPVDTDLFKQKDKNNIRKKLKIPLNKKVVVFVGRISYPKCSDILKRLIESNKDIYWILIGRPMDKEISKLKAGNYKIMESKTSKELVDYYNAADFSFCVNRESAGIGLTTEEALACGCPVIVSKEFKLKESPAVYQSNVEFNEINSKIKEFFSLSKEDKKKVAKEARKYIDETYSDKVLKRKYMSAYLD